MNQNLLLFTLGLVIIAGVGMWWWSRRFAPLDLRRTLLQMGSLMAIAILIGLGGVSITYSQTSGGPDTSETVVPVETMTVSTGDIAVTLSVAGSLVPAKEKELSFTTSAPVREVMVQVGDTVSNGDVLATLDTTDLEAQVRSAEIALAEAQAARDALVAPARELDIEIAETAVEAAQASLSSVSMGSTDTEIQIARLEVELAKNQLYQTQINRDERLSLNPEFRGQNAYAEEVTINAGVQNQELNVQTAQTEYEATLNEGPDSSSLASGNAELESAQAELESLLSGPSEADLRKADIDIENAQLNLDSVQRQLSEAVLTAPFDGIVAAENLMIGASPPENEAAITLIDLSQYTLSLNVDETDVVELSVGQTVQLDIQAIDDVEVTGRITHIDLAPTESGELVTYTTEVTLDPTQATLRPGMSAIASIILESINDVITVPNRFISTDSATQQTIVMVETAPGTYQSVPVTLGLRTLEESQVVAGLTVGQTIVLLTNGQQGTDEFGGGLNIPGLGGGGGFPGGGAPGGGAPGGGGAPPGGGF